MSLQKPYLDGLDPDATRVKVVIDWMRHLEEAFGTDGAREALRYYERRGWLTAEVRENLVGYLRGLSLVTPESEPSNWPASDGPTASLSARPFGTHARSLEYVAAVAGDDIDAAALRASMAARCVEPVGGRTAPVRPDGSATEDAPNSDGYSFSGSDD